MPNEVFNEAFYEILYVSVLLLAIGSAAVIVWLSKMKERKLMGRLEKMIDEVIAGTFTETTYDETRLSALEVKFNEYLCTAAISARKITEEKDKIKALVSDISHQTKTPIANLLLYTELLEEQEDLEEDVKSKIKEIKNQTDKLKFLIEVLIKTSRLETGIITMQSKEEKVQELIDHVIGELKPKAKRKYIEINRKSEKNVDKQTAKFDMKWTKEALINILDNAIKYTPERGSIEVEVTDYDLFYKISIIDTGIGIAKEEENLIFKRFYRSPNVQNREGVGIGLYLAREIITGEDGYITVKSELGKGSTFSVFLPKIFQNY